MNKKIFQKLGIATTGAILSFNIIEANPSWAATFTVDNTNDSGTGSLRQAILDADSLGGDNSIDFLLSSPQKITLTSGELLINSNLTINGLGADLLTISGNNASRVFEIGSDATVNISGLTITNGFSSDNSRLNPTVFGQGGGIKNNGSLRLTSSIISSNVATGSSPSGGGGIYNNGTLTVTNSTISRNSTGGFAGGGGGIANNGGTLTVTNSTISGNGTNGSGGGIGSDGILTITNSTISNNVGKYTGGIASGGPLTVVTNSTISGNNASRLFAGGITFGGTLELTNSTISGNLGPGLVKAFGEDTIAIIGNTIIAKNRGLDVSTPLLLPIIPPAAVISNGYNLIGNGDDSTGFNAVGDLVGTSTAPIDPKLGPLADNGGPTQTMALLPGSPAIDAANPNSFPATDQRGVSRPQGSRADIGAFELTQTTSPKPVPEPDSILELGFLGLISFFLSKKILCPTKK